MKKLLSGILLLSFSIALIFLSYMYLSGKYMYAGIFLSGICFGIFLMFIKLNVKDTKLNSYQRELEKEAIISDESLAKVKVLESKIQVLEKALENALNK